MRVLVTGANGFLGRCIFKGYKARATKPWLLFVLKKVQELNDFTAMSI